MDNMTRKQYLAGLEAQYAEAQRELDEAQADLLQLDGLLTKYGIHDLYALPRMRCAAVVTQRRRLVEELEEPLAHLRHAVEHGG